MKTFILIIALCSGFAIAASAQAVDEKPKSNSPEVVSELRSDVKKVDQPVVTKGVTTHGPNDVNPVRTNRQPTQATQVRSKTAYVNEATNADAVAEPK